VSTARTRTSVSPWAYILPALGAFAISLLLDVRTLMPDVGTWDTAEFQTLGPVLGIAHPTGYPTYTLLLWLASVVLQPFGDPAFRANLLSALLVSGAAALVAIAVVQLTRKPAIGLAAGALLAVGGIAWRDALRADPHTLHLFLTALLLVLLLAWEGRERVLAEKAGRWLLGASVVFGLSLGNHALTLLLAPGVAVFVLLVSPTILWRQWRLALGCAVAVVVTTVAVYAYIPLRALMDPPLDYAHPSTWERFKYLVLGEQFQSTFHQMPALSEGARTVWQELKDNLGLAAPLALLGIPVAAVRHVRVLALTGLWFLLTFLFALGYDNADIERYYLVPIMVAVIWAALAVDGIWDACVAVWRRFRPARAPRGVAVVLSGIVAVALLAVVVAPVPQRYDSVDASSDTDARAWLDATMAALAPNAVVVSWWSYSTTLWYGHFVEGLRPDITIIDDRTILDEDLGDAGAVIEKYLGERPVYLVRLESDLIPIRAEYDLEPVAGLPPLTRVYRVVGRKGSNGPG